MRLLRSRVWWPRVLVPMSLPSSRTRMSMRLLSSRMRAPLRLLTSRMGQTRCLASSRLRLRRGLLRLSSPSTRIRMPMRELRELSSQMKMLLRLLSSRFSLPVMVSPLNPLAIPLASFRNTCASGPFPKKRSARDGVTSESASDSFGELPKPGRLRPRSKKRKEKSTARDGVSLPDSPGSPVCVPQAKPMQHESSQNESNMNKSIQEESMPDEPIGTAGPPNQNHDWSLNIAILFDCTVAFAGYCPPALSGP